MLTFFRLPFFDNGYYYTYGSLLPQSELSSPFVNLHVNNCYLKEEFSSKVAAHFPAVLILGTNIILEYLANSMMGYQRAYICLTV